MRVQILRVIACTLLATLASSASNAETATLYRDHYGMPHVFSTSEPAGMYAFGYATAEDRLVATLRNYKESRGELAEIDGEHALQMDEQVRAFRLAEIARSRYDSISPEAQTDLQAFCSGFNTYRHQHPDSSPAWAWDVQPLDVVTFAEFVNLTFAIDDRQQIPDGSVALLPDLRRRPDDSSLGSNGFVVSASKLKSQHGVIVSADPHLPWSGFLRWYECQLSCGQLNVEGVTFAGLPFVAIGHNEHLAWANTVNKPDLFDIYEEHLTPASKPTAYEYDGKASPLTLHTYVFQVQEPGGAPKEVSVQVPYTRHGPVLLHIGAKYYAFCKSGVGEVGMLDQLRQEDLAVDCSAFETALSMRQLVMFNNIIGDDKGHSEYVFGGRIPRRPEGYDYSQVLPGWLKATDWEAPVDFQDLPRVSDPKAGFLQNCNDAPYYVCPDVELHPTPPKAGYPAWITGNNTTPRGIRLTKLLESCSGATVADIQAIATDTLDLDAADHLANWIAEAAQAPLPTPDQAIRDHALAVLKTWDMRRVAGSSGPTLFDAWTTALPRLAPGNSYSAEQLSDAVVAAAKALQQRGVPLDVSWGVVHRLRRGTVDLPMDGGGQSLLPNNGPTAADGKKTAVIGSSYQMVVELGNGPVHVWSYSPYGVSDNSNSPHFTDQMALASQRKFRQVPFSENEVKSDAESQQLFKWSPGAK